MAYRVGSPDSSVEGEDPMEIGAAPEVHVRMSIRNFTDESIFELHVVSVSIPLSIRNWVGAADNWAVRIWNLSVSVNSAQRVHEMSLHLDGEYHVIL